MGLGVACEGFIFGFPGEEEDVLELAGGVFCEFHAGVLAGGGKGFEGLVGLCFWEFWVGLCAEEEGFSGWEGILAEGEDEGF